MALRLDWYFLRRALKIYGAVCIVMAALLILENTPRLLALIGDTTHPLRILVQMSLALIPEYMAIGTLVACFWQSRSPRAACVCRANTRYFRRSAVRPRGCSWRR